MAYFPTSVLRKTWEGHRFGYFQAAQSFDSRGQLNVAPTDQIKEPGNVSAVIQIKIQLMVGLGFSKLYTLMISHSYILIFLWLADVLGHHDLVSTAYTLVFVKILSCEMGLVPFSVTNICPCSEDTEPVITGLGRGLCDDSHSSKQLCYWSGRCSAYVTCFVSLTGCTSIHWRPEAGPSAAQMFHPWCLPVTCRCWMWRHQTNTQDCTAFIMNFTVWQFLTSCLFLFTL